MIKIYKSDVFKEETVKVLNELIVDICHFNKFFYNLLY